MYYQEIIQELLLNYAYSKNELARALRIKRNELEALLFNKNYTHNEDHLFFSQLINLINRNKYYNR